MIKERYFVKIVPLRGETIHRFELTRQHIVVALSVLGCALVGSFGLAVGQVYHAHQQVAALRALAAKQHDQISTIDKQTATIRRQLQAVQRQNQEIQQLMGVRAKPPQSPRRTSMHVDASAHSQVALVAHHVSVLAADSAQTLEESNALRRLTMHVLNIRHLRDLARARLISAIPSIDPVDGAEVVGCFCYRSYPDAEFHPGVDLGANYGEVVHASAAGTIASAGWDGGYGLKIDIDHGNGYHSWYAHLSRMDVRPGQQVYKGQAIGEVGSTGFSTGPHLHYQIMLNGSAVDPSPYLTGVPAKVFASLP